MEDKLTKNMKKNQKLKMRKLWIQEQNTLPEGMKEKISIHKKSIKEAVDLLDEENIKDKKKEKAYNYRKRDLNRSPSSILIKEVSDKSRSILLKIGKHIRKIKRSISDITKMNGLYLEQNARNTFRITNNNKNKTLSKLNFKNKQIDELLNNKNNDKLSFFFKKDNNKDNSKDKNASYLSDNEDIYGEKHKKEDYVKNFMYVNDNYRTQLNCAFLKYNPISHLENLKILIQADPSIRKDISKIKEEVEEDIKWKCDKFYFRKKYLNFIAKNPRSKSVTPASKITQKKEKGKILPKLLRKKYQKQIMFSPQNSKAKTINIFDKIRNRENQKFNFHKEQKIEEMNHMLRATNEIDNLIKNENINNKIDLYRTDYANKMYYTNRDVISKNDSLINKDYFLDDKKKVVNKIGDLYCFQIARNVNEKEKKLKGKVKNENDQLKKRIIDGKRNTMEEFYTYINNNQVKLPDKDK